MLHSPPHPTRERLAFIEENERYSVNGALAWKTEVITVVAVTTTVILGRGSLRILMLHVTALGQGGKHRGRV